MDNTYNDSIVVIEIISDKTPPFMHFVTTDPFITDAYGVGIPMRKIIIQGESRSLRYLVDTYLGQGRYNYCLIAMEVIG